MAISVGSNDDELAVLEADQDVRLAGGDRERGDADVERHRRRRPKIMKLLDDQLAVCVTLSNATAAICLINTFSLS